MVQTMDIAWLLRIATLAAVKTAFFLLPMVAGYNVGIMVWFFPVVEFAAFAFWYNARVGAAKESVTMLKACSTCFVLMLGVSFLVMYAYYTMTDEHLRVHEVCAEMVSKWIDESPEWTKAFLERAQTLSDMAFLLVCGATAYCVHLLTTLKMDQAKQRRRDSKKDE